MNFVRFLYRKSKHGLVKFREEVTQKCSMKEALLKISIYREILALDFLFHRYQHRDFLLNFVSFFKNTCFAEPLRMGASVFISLST